MTGKLLALAFLLQTVDHQAEGTKALEAQNYPLAIEHFEKALAEDAKDWNTRFQLALAQSLMGKDAEAISNYKKVLEDQKGLYQAQLNLGMLLLRQKQPAEAVVYLETAAAQKPKEFRPVFYYAEATLGAGDPAGAEALYKTALEINGKSALAEAGLARALMKQQKLTDAGPHFRRAAELDPAFKDGLLELAVQFEAAKQIQEAVAIYQQFPDNPAARERLGVLLLDAGKAAEAIPDLEEALKKSPTTVNRMALATAYLRTKEPAKALPLMDQSVAAEPNNFELRMLYGRALRDQRQFPAAAREFFKATQLQQDSAQAWGELAGALVLADNYPQALAALDKVRALGAEAPGHYFLRAIMLDKMKDLKPALENYRKFLSLSQGKSPDQEFQARQRARIIEKELSKR
jgi:tetratricopeptide (TPR) repeat protein